MSNLTCDYQFSAMGGEFQLRCYPQTYISREEINLVFKKCEKEVLRIQKKYTEFSDSVITEINNAAGKNAIKVDRETIDLINHANYFSKLTEGIFDISSASIIFKWRELKKRGEQLSDKQRKELAKFVDFRLIQIEQNKVFLPLPEMKISFGGIGKGYAVDRCFDILRRAGIYNFFVNGSGDIRVHSHKRAPRPWRVAIQNPFSFEKVVGLVKIENGAIATSGNYKQGDHIINPVTGQSHNDIVSVTIIEETAMTCDVIGTSMMNLSIQDALRFLENNSIKGILISSQGETMMSRPAYQYMMSSTRPQKSSSCSHHLG